MPRLTNQQWKNARRAWEEEGVSLAEIARRYGVSVPTVSNHKRDEGWSRDGQPPPIPTDGFAETVEAGFAPEQRVQVYDDTEAAELRAKVAALEAELEAKNTELKEARPFIDVNLYTTPLEAIEFVGLPGIVKRAQLAHNAERKAQGFISVEFPPVTEVRDDAGRLVGIDGEPWVVALLMEEASELVDQRTRYAEESNLRTVKLAMKDRNGPRGWRLIAWPVEPQISNEAGQAGASVWKMRDKGAKLCAPYLCQRQPCWLPAAVGPDGGFVYHGYCSAAHRNEDPFLKGKQIENVITSRNGVGFSANRDGSLIQTNPGTASRDGLGMVGIG